MKTLRLEGRVFSGKGEGAEFVNLSWARRQIEQKLGFTPYPGTLNIRLDEKNTKMKKALMNAAAAEILPAPGYCRGRIFEASIMKMKCAIVIPEVLGYPENVVEVISPADLREKFHLADGSWVEVKVTS